MNEPEFEGFPWPSENWFKMPNCWTDLTAEMSKAEMKVIEYVLRHTWGFNEPGKYKHITTDGFMSGRKKKGGKRMDKGTGLSNGSVYSGLKEAIDHGYLEVKVDETDKARIRKSYRLRMVLDSMELGTKKIGDSPLKNKGLSYKNNVPNEERHLGKTPLKVGPPKKRRSAPTPKLPLSEDFDVEAGRRLLEVLTLHDSDLTHPPRRVKAATLAKSVAEIRLKRKASKDDVKAVILWLKDHYGDVHTPKMNKADDFSTCWRRFCEAKRRWEEDQQSGADAGTQGSSDLSEEMAHHGKYVSPVRQWLEREKGLNWAEPNVSIHQDDVDEALIALGHPPGACSWEQV